MIKSYIKIAMRNLRNKLTFSFINITGLAVGMAGAILIFAWVQNEYSYDSFHANKATLYKVWNRFVSPDGIGTGDVTVSPIGKALKDEYPEIKSVARVYWPINRLIGFGKNAVKASGNDVDKPFLTMFTFPLLRGDAAHALDEPNSIVLTKKLADKIFGGTDPMNKTVNINNKDAYKVTGVLKDLPNNTQFNFEYLVPWAADENFYGVHTWDIYGFNTYVQLQADADVNKLSAKIRHIMAKHLPKTTTETFLHPLTQWRLYSRFENGKIVGGRIEVVRLLMAIAGLILLIACINFMNLSTAQSQKRAKEVGVRKVIGASRLGLIKQFLSESMVIAVIAGVISLVLVVVCIPAFNRLTEKSLGVDFGNPLFWAGFIGFVAFTGVLAGSYPAFLLSGFKPVKVLKGRMFNGKNNWFNPRKVLVVVQFSVAIVLVVSTIVVYRQIKFAQGRDMGYNVSNLIQVPVEGDIKKNYEAIKNDLIASGAVTAMTKTPYDITTEGSTSSGYSVDGMDKAKQETINFTRLGTTGDFIKTMDLKLVRGRDIDFAEYPSDSTACLLNQQAVTQMGITDPIGKTINGSMKIVGVFKDFIINSPYNNIRPMIITATKSWAYNMVIRMNAKNNIARNLQLTGDVFKKYNPAYPFNFTFTDKEYQQKFNDQQQTGTLAFVFAGLTIFISCLGLFGLASYMAENRSKEIGIRKVLGASITSITQMLTGEFVTLVLIAIAIATPIAFWAMNKWLVDFTYRIQIGWLTPLLAGLAAIIIAVLTVSAQSIKAALANPVKSIKAE